MTTPRRDPSAHGTAPSGESPLRGGLPLGRWAGVPVSAHWSVLLTVLLVAELLAVSALPAAAPHRTTTDYWVTGLLAGAGLVVTLLLHELAHAVTARHYGLRVRRITLWMLGGFTELDGESPSPRADAAVAAAGPAASIVVGVVVGAPAWWLGTSGLPGAALAWLGGICVLIGVFNLLPGAPLDGGRLLRALLWWRYHDRARAAAAAARAGRFLGVVLAGLGLLEFLAGQVSGLWLALVGWFVVMGSGAEQAGAGQERLRGLTVRDVMTPMPAVAAQWWTVHQYIANVTPDQVAAPAVPVVDVGGRTVGLLTVTDLDRVAADRRDTTRLRDVVATHRRLPLIVAPDDDLADSAVAVDRHGGIAVVEQDGRPVGVITHAELTRAAHLAGLGWHTARTTSSR